MYFYKKKISNKIKALVSTYWLYPSSNNFLVNAGNELLGSLAERLIDELNNKLKNYLIKPELFNSKNDLTYLEYFTARKPDLISLKKFLK